MATDDETDDTSTATSTSPNPSTEANPIFVQTNSSGEAKVYYKLGADTEAGKQDVTVTIRKASETLRVASETFILTADDDARRGQLTDGLDGEGFWKPGKKASIT